MSIRLDRIGRGICNIIINRPSKRNALDVESVAGLREAVQNFESDQELRVAILSGSEGNFCAGYDLNQFLEPATGRPNLCNIRRMLWPLGSRLSHNKITIAALEGHAAGFGFELALKCDFRVAERDARMGFLNRRFGIPILNGGTVMLPKLIGTARALELVATGRAALTHDALGDKLITHLVDIGCALGRSMSLARSLLKFPQEALIHDLNKIRNRQAEAELQLLELERQQALAYLEGLSEPLELALRFLAGEIGRHGNMDLGNQLEPTPQVSL